MFTIGAGAKKIHQHFDQRVGKRPYPAQLKVVKQSYHARLFTIDKRSKQWFSIEDDVFKALLKIITGTKFSNDFKEFSNFIHRGKLESFHSLKTETTIPT